MNKFFISVSVFTVFVITVVSSTAAISKLSSSIKSTLKKNNNAAVVGTTLESVTPGDGKISGSEAIESVNTTQQPNGSGSESDNLSTSTQNIIKTSSESTKCIVTLWGKQYDITTLINTHPGGNVFKCGTDNTAIYQGQHGTDLSRMQKYLISGSTASTVNTGVNTNKNTNTGNSLAVNNNGVVGNGTSVSNSQSGNPASSQPGTGTSCIITLFGRQYDITTLINTHPGGNVFKCGTDNTAIYQGQHGTDLSRMNSFLISSGNTSPPTAPPNPPVAPVNPPANGNPSPPIVTNPPFNRNDDHEKEEIHEDEKDDEDDHEKEDEHESDRDEDKRELEKTAEENHD